jgi:predicted RND superfamily exporter protein
MMASPSLLIAQFGGLAAAAMVTIFVLSLTFIPAALTLWPGTGRMGASFKPSRFVPGLAWLVSRGRVFVLLAVILLAAVGTVASFRLHNEPFGDPGRNYLRSDPVRQEHEQGLKWFYNVAEPDVKANVVTFEGDLTNPAAHRYMRALEHELKKQPRIIHDTLRTIPFLMETWLTTKDGGPGAVAYLAQGRAGSPPYPQTRQAIKAEFDALYASPVRELGAIFTNGPQGGYTLGVMTFSVRAATYSQAAEVWQQVWSAIDNVSAQKPADLRVAFVGNTATNYLFVAKQVPWVFYMGTFATLGLMLIVIPFFRSFRAVVGVGLVSFATTAWWLGILPELDIGMAITLVIPTIFILALGTDYSIHLIWSIFRVGEPREVFASTGKSILFSWMTTVGPFLIFTGIQDLSVRKTMIATALAVTIIFVVTMLVVPSLYPLARRRTTTHPAPVPEVEAHVAAQHAGGSGRV